MQESYSNLQTGIFLSIVGLTSRYLTDEFFTGTNEIFQKKFGLHKTYLKENDVIYEVSLTAKLANLNFWGKADIQYTCYCNPLKSADEVKLFDWESDNKMNELETPLPKTVGEET